MRGKKKPTFLIDATGQKVPIKHINQDKVERHMMAESIMNGLVLPEAERLKKLRETLWKRIERFQKQYAKRKGAEYDPHLGATFTTYDQKMRVVVQRKTVERTNDNVELAKEFAKKCIWRWSKRSGNEFIKQVIDKTFNVGKKGFVDVKMLRRLQEIEFNDRDWKKFQAMINDSIDILETRKYILFQIRDSIDEEWDTIKLTFKA